MKSTSFFKENLNAIFNGPKLPVIFDSDEELLKKSGYTYRSKQKSVNLDSDDDMLEKSRLNNKTELCTESRKKINKKEDLNKWKHTIFNLYDFNSPIFTNKDVEEYISRKIPNEYEIMVDCMPKVGDEIITRYGIRHELSLGIVLEVDPKMKTAIIKLSESETSKDLFLFPCVSSDEKKLSFNEFTIIKKRIRPTDEEILKNMPEPYNMIVNRFPVVGDKIITKVGFDNWLPCSFGEVIDVDIENKSALIKLASDTERNFSYKNDEFAVIEEKDKITENIPEPYTKVVKRDPREYDEVITKIQLDNYPPYKVGKVIDVDFTKKEVVISIGPNDTFILSYGEWEEFAILA